MSYCLVLGSCFSGCFDCVDQIFYREKSDLGFLFVAFFSSVSPFLYLSRRFWLFFLSHEHLVLCSGCVYMGGRGNLVNGTTPPLVVNEIKGKKFGTCSSPPRRLMTVGNARCRFHPVVTSSDMRNIKAKHKRHTHTISNFDRFLQ